MDFVIYPLQVRKIPETADHKSKSIEAHDLLGVVTLHMLIQVDVQWFGCISAIPLSKCQYRIGVSCKFAPHRLFIISMLPQVYEDLAPIITQIISDITVVLVTDVVNVLNLGDMRMRRIRTDMPFSMSACFGAVSADEVKTSFVAVKIDLMLERLFACD